MVVGEEPAEAKSAALDKLVAEIHGATAVMASVPKPLKFLLPHYDALAGAHPVRAPRGSGAAPELGPPRSRAP